METEKYTTVNISHQYVHALRPCFASPSTRQGSFGEQLGSDFRIAGQPSAPTLTDSLRTFSARYCLRHSFCDL